MNFNENIRNGWKTVLKAINKQIADQSYYYDNLLLHQ